MATAGAGLGLALSKILIEMQGGRIWFTSSGVPGKAACFPLPFLSSVKRVKIMAKPS